MNTPNRHRNTLEIDGLRRSRNTGNHEIGVANEATPAIAGALLGDGYTDALTTVLWMSVEAVTPTGTRGTLLHAIALKNGAEWLCAGAGIPLTIDDNFVSFITKK